VQVLSGDQPLRFHQRGHLVALAAQADDQHASQVGMARVAGQRAAQQIEVLAR
jgi:ligand-binding sensor domain-containing protein